MSQKLSENQKQLKERFTRDRGYWNEEVWGPVLEIAPDFFEAYLNYSAIARRKGVLPPKVKELIFIAINSAATHLYQPGIRRHIANALKHGATKEEIMEVFELVSLLGIHTVTVGVPILVEELKRQTSK